MAVIVKYIKKDRRSRVNIGMIFSQHEPENEILI
jgi:hypothetical protein